MTSPVGPDSSPIPRFTTQSLDPRPVRALLSEGASLQLGQGLQEIALYATASTGGRSNPIPLDSRNASLSEISADTKSSTSRLEIATRFHKAITEAKISNLEYGWAVHVCSKGAYIKDKMRLFLYSEESKPDNCGFALDNKNIISVFKHINGAARAINILMPRAILEGGNRLDCFSVKYNLPVVYSKFGFIPVAKVAFDWTQAPNGFAELWEKLVYDGRVPTEDAIDDDKERERVEGTDIVFMIYAPEYEIARENNPVERVNEIKARIQGLRYSPSYDEADMKTIELFKQRADKQI